MEVLEVGPAERFSTDVGPVIDEEASERVRAYAGEAERVGEIAARAAPGPGEGWFCAATVACGLWPRPERPGSTGGGVRTAPDRRAGAKHRSRV
ncbi:MAG: hypothetical protein H0U32_00755 [Thermoleophilaceae bacterium]|nr:hypothetical protein [Thermoleophilaceae bacterium]